MSEQKNAAAAELTAMKRAWRDQAARWELTLDERQALLPTGGEGLPSPPGDTEVRMRILIDIGRGLGGPDGAAGIWLRTPQAVLGGIAPLDVMGGKLGDLRGVRRLVEEGHGS